MKRLWLLLFLLFAAMSAQSQTCSATCNLSGVVNDYWPGSADRAVGSNTIAVGARRAGGAGATIATGDLLLVIQMQDAVVNTTNGTNYGANAGTGSGYTDARQTGRHEFVYASNAVGAGGGTINLSTNLINAYNITTTAGQQTTPTFQVIRVPNCVTGTLTAAISAPAWSTSTGGVVAIRAINLNLNGQTINVEGMGFRGGATDAHNGPSDTNNFRSNTTTDQFKGEGIAGAPRYIFNRATTTEIDTGLNFPNGNRARGAPGNAGGGGEGDSGGGGGGNGGAGGVGGVWDGAVGDNGGGRGGVAFAERAFSRLVMGGGGGGGSAGADGGTESEALLPYGTGGRAFSRGGAGGGIVLIQATNRTGNLTINADGQGAPFTAPPDGVQVGGGGGAGGSIVLYGTGGTIQANASGGNGATGRQDSHIAQGGGGGGGVVFSSSATGVTANTSAGRAGCQVSGFNDSTATACNTGGNAATRSSTQGVAGPTLQTFIGSPPGNPLCAANLSITKSNGVNSLAAGQTTTYTLTLRNQGPSPADGTVLRDPVATGLSCNAVTCSASVPAGNCPASGVNIANLQGSGITLTSLPANSTLQFSVTCGVTATGQ